MQINRDGPNKRDAAWSLLIVTPDENTKSADVLGFTNSAGPTLVVLPKWETTPDGANAGWVQSAGLIDPATLGGLLTDTAPAQVARRTDTAPAQLTNAQQAGQPAVSTGPIAQLQTISGKDWVPVLTGRARRDCPRPHVRTRAPMSWLILTS